MRILVIGGTEFSTKNAGTLYRHVSAEDVAQAFFLAVGNEKAFNQTYNVAGDEVLTIETCL